MIWPFRSLSRGERKRAKKTTWPGARVPPLFSAWRKKSEIPRLMLVRAYRARSRQRVARVPGMNLFVSASSFNSGSVILTLQFNGQLICCYSDGGEKSLRRAFPFLLVDLGRIKMGPHLSKSYRVGKEYRNWVKAVVEVSSSVISFLVMLKNQKAWVEFSQLSCTYTLLFMSCPVNRYNVMNEGSRPF